MIDYNWWPPARPPFEKPPHYWVNQVTGQVRSFPCGDPQYRSTSEVYGRPVPTMAYYTSKSWPTPKEMYNWYEVPSFPLLCFFLCYCGLEEEIPQAA